MKTIHLTDAGFKQTIQGPDPVLVDFWAPWCGPCRMVGPIIDELAADYQDQKVTICKMNVDENSVIPSEYGIRSIPTLLIFKHGQVVDRIVGAVSKEALEGKLNMYIA